MLLLMSEYVTAHLNEALSRAKPSARLQAIVQHGVVQTLDYNIDI